MFFSAPPARSVSYKNIILIWHNSSLKNVILWVLTQTLSLRDTLQTSQNKEKMFQEKMCSICFFFFINYYKIRYPHSAQPPIGLTIGTSSIGNSPTVNSLGALTAAKCCLLLYLKKNIHSHSNFNH